MFQTREDILFETARLYMRAAGVLDPVRLQVWESMKVSFPQLRILFRVRAHPGIDVRGLAAELGISPSAVSQQVDKLVARGLIQRTDKPEDRRYVVLELTDEGQQAAGEISRASHARVESLLSGLTDEELTDLGRLLDRVLEQVGP